MKRMISICITLLLMVFSVSAVDALNIEQILNAVYNSSDGSINLTLSSWDLNGDFVLENDEVINNSTNSVVEIQTMTALTNTVANMFLLEHQTSGSPANGIGTGFGFQTETSAANVETGFLIQSVTTDVTGASEDFKLVFLGMTAGAAASEKAMFGPTENVFNDASADLDFRVEGDGNANLAFVDAGNDLIGIGHASPDKLFHVEETTALTNTITYPVRITHATSGTEAAGIGLGIEFEQETTDGNETGATIEVVTTDVTGASEDFDFVVSLMDAGSAVTERLRIDSDGAVSQTMTGTVKQFVYQADALADDGTVSLPDATSGMAFVVANAEAGYWIVASDGSVVKISGSTNTAATDSDTDLCIFDGGTSATVKNRLGTTGEIRIVYMYN